MKIGTTILILSLLSLASSCGTVESFQESVQRLPETQIRITDDIMVTKNGVLTGNVSIKPTIFRPTINEIRYPRYFGLTIKYKF